MLIRICNVPFSGFIALSSSSGLSTLKGAGTRRFGERTTDLNRHGFFLVSRSVQWISFRFVLDFYFCLHRPTRHRPHASTDMTYTHSPVNVFGFQTQREFQRQLTTRANQFHTTLVFLWLFFASFGILSAIPFDLSAHVKICRSTWGSFFPSTLLPSVPLVPLLPAGDAPLPASGPFLPPAA